MKSIFEREIKINFKIMKQNTQKLSLGRAHHTKQNYYYTRCRSFILEVLEGDAPRGSAEFEPRVALSMGRKITEIP